MFSGFNDFKHIMKAKRDAGYVTCEIGCRKHSSNLLDVNHFVKRHGYHGLGDQWNAVDEQTARNLMSYIRSKDLAYEYSLSSEPIASELCDYFLRYFSDDPVYDTNADVDVQPDYVELISWSPISQATFDAGLVVIDKKKIGMIWAEDEDEQIVKSLQWS